MGTHVSLSRDPWDLRLPHALCLLALASGCGAEKAQVPPTPVPPSRPVVQPAESSPAPPVVLSPQDECERLASAGSSPITRLSSEKYTEREGARYSVNGMASSPTAKICPFERNALVQTLIIRDDLSRAATRNLIEAKKDPELIPDLLHLCGSEDEKAADTPKRHAGEIARQMIDVYPISDTVLYALTALDDPQECTRLAALNLLKRIKEADETMFAPVAARAADDDPVVAETAVRILLKLNRDALTRGAAELKAPLEKALSSGDAALLDAAAQLAAATSDPAWAQVLLQKLPDLDAKLTMSFLKALEALDPKWVERPEVPPPLSNLSELIAEYQVAIKAAGENEYAYLMSIYARNAYDAKRRSLISMEAAAETAENALEYRAKAARLPAQYRALGAKLLRQERAALQKIDKEIAKVKDKRWKSIAHDYLVVTANLFLEIRLGEAKFY